MNFWHGFVALLSGLGLLALLGLKRKCEKMKPLVECHTTCGHDHACHKQCPLPECNKMRQEVEGTLQCHEKCAGDAACHHACPHPFERLRSKCEELENSKACGGQPEVQGGLPKQWEHHHEEHGEHGEHGEGEHRWIEAMRGMWACKTKCCADAACAEQCPKPWTVIQEKCEKAKPIIECHMQCGHDQACHVKCPTPEEPRWKDIMEQTLKCHGECGSDAECHHSCRHPVAWARDKCAKFDKVHVCHQACAHGDFECHLACPGMFDWHHDGEHHHEGFWHHHGEQKEAMGQRHGEENEDKAHHGHHHHHGEDSKDHGHHHHHGEEHDHGEHHHGDDDKEHQEHHHNGHHHGHHGMAEVEEARDTNKEREEHGKERWIEAMKARTECKEKCGTDEACIEQCPKPWVHMQEKCDKMQPIVKCHMNCGRDRACHEACPMPECPKMKQKMEETTECHGKCGSDFSCHSACPRPLMFVREKCEKFGKVHECHTACAHGDHACHGACPKLYEINA